jgi:hypothetical protein
MINLAKTCKALHAPFESHATLILSKIVPKHFEKEFGYTAADHFWIYIIYFLRAKEIAVAGVDPLTLAAYYNVNLKISRNITKADIPKLLRLNLIVQVMTTIAPAVPKYMWCKLLFLDSLVPGEPVFVTAGHKIHNHRLLQLFAIRMDPIARCIYYDSLSLGLKSSANNTGLVRFLKDMEVHFRRLATAESSRLRKAWFRRLYCWLKKNL